MMKSVQKKHFNHIASSCTVCQVHFVNREHLNRKMKLKNLGPEKATDSRQFVKFLLHSEDHKSALAICHSIIKGCIGCNLPQEIVCLLLFFSTKKNSKCEINIKLNSQILNKWGGDTRVPEHEPVPF